jgi:non-heme chloroperoxidase
MKLPAPARVTRVTAPDGVSLAVQEWGDPEGPPLVLVHGFLQCHLSWAKQVAGPLARRFRIVTCDLRGHGGSDKPLEERFYRESAIYADDLRAILRATRVKRPVLVGWSYGTRVICDYLLRHGPRGIAGANLAGPAISDDPRHRGPAMHRTAILSDDLVECIEGTRTFLRACFATPPAGADFERMLAFNMLPPAPVRRWMRRPAPYHDMLAALDLPVLVSHGTRDAVTRHSLGRYVATTVPGARLSSYRGVGHAPFWEDAPRFNRELAKFAGAVR